jgi:hypothetical protein
VFYGDGIAFSIAIAPFPLAHSSSFEADAALFIHRVFFHSSCFFSRVNRQTERIALQIGEAELARLIGLL